jgi:hypothetical protein
MTGGRRLVLDAGGVRRLAERDSRSLALLRALGRHKLWPPLVPTVALVECLSGDSERDEPVLRLLRTCELVSDVPVPTARRAAWLRTAAARGTATDALVVALAEPGGSVLSGGRRDLEALALFADEVFVERA